MITLPELLKDPEYKAYFSKVPKLPPAALASSTPPWRLMIEVKPDLDDTRRIWRQGDFLTYGDAFRVLKKNMSILTDGAIISKRIQFPQPLTRVKVPGKFAISKLTGKRIAVFEEIPWQPPVMAHDPEGHNWCPYCRRPTIFAKFRKHHALRKSPVAVDPTSLRCWICGTSERLVVLR